jgi:acetate kinase
VPPSIADNETGLILTVNAGSTSLKLETYDLGAALPEIAAPPPPVWLRRTACGDFDAIDEALSSAVAVVAHRFVRLPDGAADIVTIDDAFLGSIEAVASEAPLHDSAALGAAREIRARRPQLPQLAVADGAFHRTLSPAAATYAIPRALTARGLRRLGYHGLSHEYAAHRAAWLAGVDIRRSRIVTLHLGGGSSLCAIANARSVDTTMGFTPLEGVPMATRSGSVDPGLLLHLLRSGMTVDELADMLEYRSGLAGISGRSGDLRELLVAGDDDSRLALDVLGWRVRAALGAMIAVLGGVDLIAFTGGVGEGAATIRAAVLQGASAWGAELDAPRNAALAGEGPITTGASRVQAYAIAARENWQLARAAFAVTARGRAPGAAAARG